MNAAKNPETELERRSVVARLLQDRGELLVITGLGSSSYDAHAAADDDRNFYLWGAMGGAAMIGLGLALAQPQRQVLVLTGDGEMLMGMGSCASIARQAATNLSIVVLDNGHFGETGMQQSHTAATDAGGCDLAAVATACGFPHSMVIEDADGLDRLAARIHRPEGPLMAVVKIAATNPPRSLPTTDGVWLKNRFRRSLGLFNG